MQVEEIDPALLVGFRLNEWDEEPYPHTAARLGNGPTLLVFGEPDYNRGTLVNFVDLRTYRKIALGSSWGRPDRDYHGLSRIDYDRAVLLTFDDWVSAFATSGGVHRTPGDGSTLGATGAYFQIAPPVPDPQHQFWQQSAVFLRSPTSGGAVLCRYNNPGPATSYFMPLTWSSDVKAVMAGDLIPIGINYFDHAYSLSSSAFAVTDRGTSSYGPLSVKAYDYQGNLLADTGPLGDAPSGAAFDQWHTSLKASDGSIITAIQNTHYANNNDQTGTFNVTIHRCVFNGTSWEVTSTSPYSHTGVGRDYIVAFNERLPGQFVLDYTLALGHHSNGATIYERHLATMPNTLDTLEDFAVFGDETYAWGSDNEGSIFAATGEGVAWYTYWSAENNWNYKLTRMFKIGGQEKIVGQLDQSRVRPYVLRRS